MDYSSWVRTAFCKRRLSCFVAIILLFILPHHQLLALSSPADERENQSPVSYATRHISFPEFNSSNERIHHDLKLLGSCILTSNGSIHIPDTTQKRDISHLVGRAIYSAPVRLFDPNTKTAASFQTTFSFQINVYNSPTSGGGGQSQGDADGDGGSGLTFLIAPDEFTVGRPGAWLGMLNDACDDQYKFVAIEFDTRYNPEFGDPNDNHIGINLGSIISNKTINMSDFGIELNDGSVHQAYISYDGFRKWMDVKIGSFTSGKQNGGLKSVFSGMIDLSPYLKEYMFVGFSASTGKKTQIHSVSSWNFTSSSPAYIKFPSQQSCQDKIIVKDNYLDLSKEKRPSMVFVIFVAVVVALLCVTLLTLYITNRWRKHGESNSGKTALVLPEMKVRPTPPHKPRKFSAAELTSATRGFSEYEILTGDCNGVMYRGTLSNGNLQVSVKRFSAEYINIEHIEKKPFKKRFKLLSEVKHPNLKVVRGWCYNKGEIMVVYEYMFNGCLDRWLFGVGVLPWNRRFKVIKHVAKGLNHLHSCQLAHKNVKVSSVYLDVNFKAVLGDFGPDDATSESKMIDFGAHQQGDVFDFGIFMLEMVAGRRRSALDATDRVNMESSTSSSGSSAGNGEVRDQRMMMMRAAMDLLDYAWMMHEKGEKINVVDQRMGLGINTEQAIHAVQIGLLCTLSVRNGNPKMEDVLKYLKLETPLPELPTTRPVVFYPYNSGPSLALCTSAYVCAAF